MPVTWCNTGCGFVPLHEEIKYLFTFIFSFLGEKWGTECLNTKFPLPTVLCAGYSVKLKKNRDGNYLLKAFTCLAVLVGTCVSLSEILEAQAIPSVRLS